MWFFRKKESPEFYSFFRNTLGFTPRRVDLYRVAFTHKSMSQNAGHGHLVNNERLEYLGDAVLSTIVAEFLYRKYPYQGEGFLTEMRSKMVSRNTLNMLSRKLGLLDLVHYDRSQQGVFKSMGGNTFESLVGAIYLERGYDFTRRVIEQRIINLHMDIDELEHTGWNYKGKLIDWGQKHSKKISFEIVRVIQPTRHDRKQYEVRVLVGGEAAETGIDYTIKAAEQLAAENTFKKLNPPAPQKRS